MQNGLYCPAAEVKDDNYVNIGKKDIISKRERKAITVAPYGRIHDYVSFYFGPRSPMLFSIYKGNSDTNCKQSEIIYIVTSIDKISEQNIPFVFTSGQAIMQLSSQHNDIKDLSKIDWDIIFSKYWNDIPPDYDDRKRQRMAEFLVHEHVPLDCIIGIVVMSIDTEKIVQKILSNAGSRIQVYVKRDWYY